MVSHGIEKTPKHIGLAIAVKSETGNSSLITMLNKLGHTSSYSTLERMETSLGSMYMEQYLRDGVVIPACIHRGLFVQVAADNNDLQEETIDGKNTTHSTAIVIYQKDSGLPFRRTVPKDGTSLPRNQALDVSDLYTIKPFFASGKKPATSQYVGKTKAGWFTYNQYDHVDHTDFTWMRLRLHCHQSNDECVNRQIIPSWSGFNATMSTSETVKSVIGYCPMIPASPTEYSTVYTLLLTIKRIMERLEQKNEVVTVDEAIYCKAKEVIWRRPFGISQYRLELGRYACRINFLGSYW